MSHWEEQSVYAHNLEGRLANNEHLASVADKIIFIVFFCVCLNNIIVLAQERLFLTEKTMEIFSSSNFHVIIEHSFTELFLIVYLTLIVYHYIM